MGDETYINGVMQLREQNKRLRHNIKRITFFAVLGFIIGDLGFYQAGKRAGQAECNERSDRAAIAAMAYQQLYGECHDDLQRQIRINELAQQLEAIDKR